MAHIADEPRRSMILHGVLPAALAVFVLVASIAMEVSSPGEHWMQRAGSVVTVLGAYVAYIDAKRSVKVFGNDLYLNFELPYRLISIGLVIVGTLVWGYGDLLL